MVCFTINSAKKAEIVFKFYNFNIKLYILNFIVLFTQFNQRVNLRRFETYAFRAFNV